LPENFFTDLVSALAKTLSFTSDDAKFCGIRICAQLYTFGFVRYDSLSKFFPNGVAEHVNLALGLSGSSLRLLNGTASWGGASESGYFLADISKPGTAASS